MPLLKRRDSLETVTMATAEVLVDMCGRSM